MSTSSVALSFSTLASRHQQYLDSLVLPSREEFERIARAQDEKEEQIRRRLREQRGHRNAHAAQDEKERTQAARAVEQTFQGMRARKGRDGYTPDPTSRWIAAMKELRFREATKPRLARLQEVATGSSLSSGSQDTASTVYTDALRCSAAKLNWKKIGMIARRAGHDDSDNDDDDDDDNVDNVDGDGESVSSSSSPEPRRRRWSPWETRKRENARRQREEANAQRRQTALTLGLQYWLEIIDAKHRYGTNLRMYHEEWRKASTSDNFFTWLDHGDGRFISLQTCSREQLERDQVRYLSREERRYYLATVDERGRICWARTGEPITTSDRFKDSAYGIVPADDDTTPPYERAKARGNKKKNDINGDGDSDGDDGHADNGDLGLFAVAKQKDNRLGGSVNPVSSTSASLPPANDDDDPQRPMKKVFQFSATSTFDKLLRKFVKDGTWIFVADTSFRLYVGIKQAGAFQHSSFLQGGRISAGGLIEIKDGRLTSLSPLSGHYRPPTSNFRAFVRSLEAEGVDVTGVSVLKSYAVLYGLETYVKARQKGRGLMQMVRGSAKGGERRERERQTQESPR
ncbi:hypothetical protein ESCO_005112 [Escovopsis weberi]|uniref:IQ domain-containing protein IQM6 n=1 Tax=Escovopsis weberi TaxID=150374 RepID=A0A0N0RTY0_ESCWE|nr:hypothetical protein ESCO_005112 [Escovopsis weberi]